jgi:hypothetical protein
MEVDGEKLALIPTDAESRTDTDTENDRVLSRLSAAR